MSAAALIRRIEAGLDAPVRDEVRGLATRLAEASGAVAVLFYGSNLRTGSLDGVLDFYLLAEGPPTERIWPRVGYHEGLHGETMLRAKTAQMTLARFARACSGRSRDTTVWARFVQPSALVYCANDTIRARIVEACAEAAMTAARLAAALGPPTGTAEDYWRALFRATYTAEFRVESAGREDSILAANRGHFSGLLPLAWDAAGIAFESDADHLTPCLSEAERARIGRWWKRRRRLGKPLNILRLAKATTTFEGAARYGAWKLERHTGLKLEVTPFRERHPLLAMPGAAWELWRVRRRSRSDQR